jgi:Holliday junction resolvase RusA-like endonuclease
MDGDPPLEGPLSLSLRFRFPIRKTGTKASKAAKAAGEIAPTVKPDWDNAAKSICDALNGVVFRDDSQIVRAFVTKVYSDRPGVDVRVEAFAPQGGDE